MAPREIKFRVWDIQNERMVEDPYLFRPAMENEHGAAYEFFEHWQDVDDGINRMCHVMQYTVLKDKNGREIYEGDIVKWGHIEGGIEYPVRIAEVRIGGQVEFVSRQKEIVRRGDDEYRFGYGSFAYQDTERWLEVIGNIYENPELLQP